MPMIEVTNETFSREVLESNTPVVVDFWAPWCGPCKQLAPVLEKAAAEFRPTLKIVKVNVDDQPELAERFGIRGIPTLLSFKNGEVVDSMVGTKSFGLDEWLRKHAK